MNSINLFKRQYKFWSCRDEIKNADKNRKKNHQRWLSISLGAQHLINKNSKWREKKINMRKFSKKSEFSTTKRLIH